MLKQKIKTKIKQLIGFSLKAAKLAGALCFIMGIYWTVISGIIVYGKLTAFIADPVNTQLLTEINVPKARAEEELSIKDYVKQEIEKAGLGSEWELIKEMIQCESLWDDYAYNVNWEHKSVDTGLWMINSCHKNTISVEERFDYKTATKWAIEKRLRDGNWCAWVCSRKVGLCN